jgi:hypothetical protein
LNTLVPLDYYTPIYFHFLLLVVLVMFYQSTIVPMEASENLNRKNQIGIFLLIAVLAYMGLRPISFVFGDMGIYAREFKMFVYGKIPEYETNILFEFIMYNFSQLGSAEAFFFFCAMLYIIPLYYVSKSLFKDYWYYSFLILITSFSFWAFGTNGIRNGIATSLFLFALTRKNFTLQILIFVAIVFIHKSSMLIILSFFLVKYIKDPKLYFAFWSLAIPLSLALGGFWEAFFLGLGFGEEAKLDAYLGEFDQANEGVVLKTGFRWDFLLYSASGIFAAWYYTIKRGFKDEYYLQLVNMYLFLNGLWILVIRSNYSNRFAYLSWFMLGLIIIYPLLKNKLFDNQHAVVGRIIAIYFLFTYLLNVILA